MNRPPLPAETVTRPLRYMPNGGPAAADAPADAPENNRTQAAPALPRQIHLLYSPTLGCNLSCRYCYLGEQTTTAAIKTDAERAVATLQYALTALEAAGVLAFNVSLHGGEVTVLPPRVLEALFSTISRHYLRHFDQLQSLGHKKSAPHIKTNLFKFASQYEMLNRHKVSVSASIDLPLALHAKYRTTRSGGDWLDRTLDNIRLLARYPHAKKISATVSQEHLADIDAFIADIWFIHRELGFDMNQFNLMFAFASELNDADQGERGEPVLTPATPAQQQQLYHALKQAFTGTELEDGMRRNWFDEFKPSYCTNAYNCGERFYLLQGDGSVYSCVRGQGIPEFCYGNIYQDSIDTILANGARQISAIHQRFGLDDGCAQCGHLSTCHSGCPVVKFQSQQAKSYTCDLQKQIYRDNPHSYPADDVVAQQTYLAQYTLGMHPALAMAQQQAKPNHPAAQVVLPNDLYQDKNSLSALIAADPVLQSLYRPDAFMLQLADETIALESQLLKASRTCYTLAQGDALTIHLPRALFAVACDEPVRNTLYLQMLRDTPVVYGDEARSKQAHLFTWQLYADCLLASDQYGPDWVMADLAPLLEMHRHLFRHGVANNLLFTTGYLREYHYQKQKNNAFYHIQATNLPFQNLEFFYLAKEHHGA
jgi:uncharacterized protein